MTNEEFGEFYNRTYRPMPDDFYPEIVSETDPETGRPIRRIGLLKYVDGLSFATRAAGDQALRRWEWTRLEIERINKLGGIS